MAKNDINYNTLINVGLVIGGYYLIAKPILNKLGVTDSTVDKNKNNALQKNNWFKKDWYQTAPNGTLLLTVNWLWNNPAEMIYTANGYYGGVVDSPFRVKSALSLLSNKYQVSQLADVFNKKYNLDLLTYLQSFLDTSEMAENVYDPIDRLPLITKK